MCDTFFPFSIIFHVYPSKSQSSICTSVVFPAHVLPTIAILSPFFCSNDIFCSTALSLLYQNERFLISSHEKRMVQILSFCKGVPCGLPGSKEGNSKKSCSLPICIFRSSILRYKNIIDQSAERIVANVANTNANVPTLKAPANICQEVYPISPHKLPNKIQNCTKFIL